MCPKNCVAAVRPDYSVTIQGNASLLRVDQPYNVFCLCPTGMRVKSDTVYATLQGMSRRLIIGLHGRMSNM